MAGKVRAGAKPKCEAKTRQTGKPCRHPAGFRTDHPGFGACWMHGGKTKTGRKSAELQKLEEQTMAMSDEFARRHISPNDLMRASINLTAHHIEFLNSLAAKFKEMDSPEAYAIFKLLQREKVTAANIANAASAMGYERRQKLVAEANQQELVKFIEAVVKEAGLTAAQKKKIGPAARKVLASQQAKAKAPEEERPEIVDAEVVEDGNPNAKRQEQRRKQAEALGVWPKSKSVREADQQMLRDFGFYDDGDRWERYCAAELARRKKISTTKRGQRARNQQVLAEEYERQQKEEVEA